MHSIPREVIDNKIHKLQIALPSKPTAVNKIYPPAKELPNMDVFSSCSEESLQKISDHIGYYLGLLKNVKVRVVKSSGSSIAGVYKVISYDHSEILINLERIYNHANVLSILAHECTHNYLFQHSIADVNEEQNEILTDIATVYLGLGSILLDGYRVEHWYTENHEGDKTLNEFSLGYLPYIDILYTFAKVAEIRGWSPDEIFTVMPTEQDIANIKPFLKDYMKNLKKKDKLNEELRTLHNKWTKIKSSIQNNQINGIKVNKKDGHIFVNIMNEITVGNLENQLNNMINKINNIDSFKKEYNQILQEIKKDMKDISRNIKKWLKIVDKYVT